MVRFIPDRMAPKIREIDDVVGPHSISQSLKGAFCCTILIGPIIAVKLYAANEMKRIYGRNYTRSVGQRR